MPLLLRSRPHSLAPAGPYTACVTSPTTITNPHHLWLTTCMPGATAGCRPTRSHVSTAPPTAIHAKKQCLRLQVAHCMAVTPPPQVTPPHTTPQVTPPQASRKSHSRTQVALDLSYCSERIQRQEIKGFFRLFGEGSRCVGVGLGSFQHVFCIQ